MRSPVHIGRTRLKKCNMVSVFTLPDVNTQEVGRTRDKRMYDFDS